jgi:hypothetical protein
MKVMSFAAKARAARAEARAERRYAQEQAEWENRRALERVEWEKRWFKETPAHNVLHGEDGSVSFTLEPPGKPTLNIKLENGRMPGPPGSGGDFTGLREGDRVNGTLGSDGRSLDSIWIALEDRFRYTIAGWTVVLDPDGGPPRVYHEAASPY